MAKTFYIIDGHAQIYRAFYAPFRELTSPTGEPTRATYVFFQMLFGLIRQQKPDYLAMALDPRSETIFRNEIDSTYKANRDPAPEALHVQADRIRSIVVALGIPVYCIPGFEADDVMATLAARLQDDPIDVYLVSRDKDLEQLITDRVRLFDPGKSSVVDAASLEAKKGYSPKQAVEIQTLTGDSTDNIRGVHGIGVKTAAKLIAKYGSADAVMQHADDLTPKMCERVKAFAGEIDATRQLVTLRSDVPVDFDLSACACDTLNAGAVRPIFDELGIRRLNDTLDALAGSAPSTATPPTLVPQALTTEVSPGNYKLVDTLAALDELGAALRAQPVFAFDTETTGLHPVADRLVGLSFSWQSGTGWYVPVRAAVGNVLPVMDVVERLRPMFEDASIGKVGQNLKFDMLVLRQVGMEVKGAQFDTLLAAFLLDPLRRSNAMDNLVRDLLGHQMIPISELIGKGKNQITLDELDTQRVGEYAGEDADFTWRLKELFEPQLAGSDVEPLFRDTEMPLIEVLVEMEHNGIALDVDLLNRLGESMAERLVALTHDLHEAAGYAFNVDSPKQLAVVLFDEQGLSVVRKTKTGRSTDADTLKTLAEQSDNPIPGLVMDYRELAKLKSTYVDALPKAVCKRTGRVHATFNQTGAITGRLSSSDPNLQNIPIRTEMGRRIRAAIVAGEPDSVLLTADYSQIELRILAHFCKDRALLDVFRDDLDIHRSVAAQINGVSLEDVTSSQRSAAKAVNFGIIYGQSPFGLARALSIPVGEARAFIDTYFMRYPGIRLFIDECIAKARTTGYAETILGRRRPIPELSSRNRQQIGFGERIAVNTVIQGSAADLIKRAMIDMHACIKNGHLGDRTRMLIQVHDELVFEVPESEAEQVAAKVRAIMEDAMPLEAPLKVDVGWGRNWAEGK